jgi:hypothetical protein
MFCLVDRNGICMHLERMDTSDLPTSVEAYTITSLQILSRAVLLVVVLYLLVGRKPNSVGFL